MESFLYVLLLFFSPYAGPLPKAELENAHENGFVRPVGSGRLPRMRSWPETYVDWADGDPQAIGKCKAFDVWSPNGLKYLDESAELMDCIKNN